jgi:FtsP/CotA-like multicopper oxidase with cupredoxin domain
MENRPSNILILNREKVRVRVINGGASTFWMTLGEDPVLVSSDGHDVVPVVKQDIYWCLRNL